MYLHQNVATIGVSEDCRALYDLIGKLDHRQLHQLHSLRRDNPHATCDDLAEIYGQVLDSAQSRHPEVEDALGTDFQRNAEVAERLKTDSQYDADVEDNSGTDSESKGERLAVQSRAGNKKVDASLEVKDDARQRGQSNHRDPVENMDLAEESGRPRSMTEELQKQKRR